MVAPTRISCSVRRRGEVVGWIQHEKSKRRVRGPRVEKIVFQKQNRAGK